MGRWEGESEEIERKMWKGEGLIEKKKTVIIVT